MKDKTKKTKGASWSSYKKAPKKIPSSEIEKKDVKKSKSTEKYLIWHVEGGVGKHVAATSVLPFLKEKHYDRKFILVAAWPEIFLNHTSVDRLYTLGQTPHFYEDYIENKDTIIYKHEAYNQTAHVHKSQHLIHNWCDLMGLDYSEEKYVPTVVLNYAQQQLAKRWTRDKPTMVLHTHGGPYVGQKFSYNWCRDMPTELAQEIVNNFSNKYHIFQVCRKESPILNGVERIDDTMTNIELFSILATSTKRVLIDSCLQHAARAFQLPSTVLWIGTSPKVFGYKYHNNIIAKQPIRANQIMNSYVFDYGFDSNVHECPYTTYTDIFESHIVIRNIGAD